MQIAVKQFVSQGSACLGLALALALAASPATAADYKSEYRLSSIAVPPLPWAFGAERWVELIKEKTNGRINVKIYTGASLINGEQTREFTALRQGIIDLSVGTTLNWSPQMKELNLFSVPFLVPNPEALQKVVHGPVGDKLKALIAEKGVVPLAWGENGVREITNSRRPIKTPDDMKGLKFRVVGSPIFIDTFSALGANPTQMSWADAQAALATGAVDGQETPMIGFKISKLDQLNQKYITRWGYVIDPLIFAVNEAIWKSWSPEDQAAVRAAAEQAATEQIALAHSSDSAGLEKEIEGLGVSIVHLTEAEIKPFRDATQNMRAKWAKEIGSDLVKQTEAEVAKH